MSISENKTQLSPKSKTHSSQIFPENKLTYIIYIYSAYNIMQYNIIRSGFVIATSCRGGEGRWEGQSG